LAFKAAILDRKPSLRLLINGNPLTENTLATINAWLKKGQENEEMVDDVDFPKPEEEPRQVQFDFLQKELMMLRQQVATLQTMLNDKQRQLDTSAFRITELEQQLARESYRGNHLQDALSEANLRVSILNDQVAALTMNWDKERSQIITDYSAQLKMKDKLIRDLTIERDDYKTQRDLLAVRNRNQICFSSLVY
jgi:chromosome segregation ATPase